MQFRLPKFFQRSKTIDQLTSEYEERIRSASAGQFVNVDTALGQTTVFACIDAIATGVAVPDAHVMRALGDGRTEKAVNTKSYRVIHRRPNEWQTALEFRETLTMHAALTGNAFAIPTYRGRELLELLPLLPSMVTIRTSSRYQILYDVQDDFGILGTFKHDEIFHLKNRSWDRIKGLDSVKQARKAIGLSMATEENLSSLQSNGGKPGGILTTEQKLAPDSIERIKTAWQGATTGRNAYKTPVLDAGLSYEQMGMSAIDQQTNETRRMQVEEICRAFGVFPQIVGHSDKATTFGSAEAFFAAHHRLTIAKWQKNWCEKLDEFVLDGSGPLFIQFDNRAMNAANLKDTGDFYAKALGSGGSPPWMTQNEVRAEQGLPPIEGGDILFKPTNAIIDED